MIPYGYPMVARDERMEAANFGGCITRVSTGLWETAVSDGTVAIKDMWELWCTRSEEAFSLEAIGSIHDNVAATRARYRVASRINEAKNTNDSHSNSEQYLIINFFD